MVIIIIIIIIIIKVNQIKEAVLEDCHTHVMLVAREFLSLPSYPLKSWSVVTFSSFYGRKNERKNCNSQTVKQFKSSITTS